MKTTKTMRLSALAAGVTASLFLAGAELAPAWAQGAAEGFARFAHAGPKVAEGRSATLLPDGRWLEVGGTLGRPSSALRIVSAASGGSVVETLPMTLGYARSGQSATVLPDGTVLVVGGKGADGRLVTAAERIDLQSQTVQKLEDTGLYARTLHSATLLTTGQVLIAGGEGADGKPIELSELWDMRTGKAVPYVAALKQPRTEPQSALLANGKGLIWGGKDDAGQPVEAGELYDPVSRLFNDVQWWDTAALPSPTLAAAAPQLEASVPKKDATDVAVDSRVAVRFSEALNVRTVNADTVTLIGPSGPVSGKVVAAEGGMLAFFTPAAELLPDTTYTAFFTGVTDVQGRALPFTSFSFTTHRFSGSENGQGGTAGHGANGGAGGKAGGGRSGSGASVPGAGSGASNPGSGQEEADSTRLDDGEDWIPQEKNRHGDWRVLGLAQDPVLHAELLKAPLPQAKAGVTAISGRVLRLNGRPLAGVEVSYGKVSMHTDDSGLFLLSGVPAGHLQLKVDGTVVQSGGRHYTSHFIEIDTRAGKTASVPNPIFLPRVDPATEVTIASPTDHEVVLTHPAIPGLEVHIPKGAVLRTYDGKIVTQLSITPIPVDRAPYPAPVNFSTYFTLQPGGAYVDGDPSKAVRIVYPNYQGLAPGTVVNFWNYDPATQGWKVYGKGVVTADGKQVIPNPGVGFRQIMTFGFGVQTATPAPPTGPSCPDCEGGDPVDVSTGLFLHSVKDISLKDVMPIEVSRTYHQNDPQFHEFGLGTTFSYAMYLENPSTINYQTMNLVTADGTRIPFTLTSGSSGSLTSSNVYRHNGPSSYNGAVMTVDASNELFYVTLVGGTKLTFGTHHTYNQLQAISDANGNTISLTIAGSSLTTPGGTASGNVTQITSPNGRYITLTYGSVNDANGNAHQVIKQATDNLGRSVIYNYDTSARLWTVQDMDGNTETYGYDSSNRMTTVTDKNGNTMVTNNTFDANNRVTQQTLADGSIWKFSYTLDSTNTYVAQTTVTDPRSYVSVYSFNASGQASNIVLAQGKPEQKTYAMVLDTNSRVTQVTDSNNRVTKYVYGDSYGGPTTVTYLYGTPSAVTYTMQYDPVYHNPAVVTDPLGHTTRWNYNSSGNLYQAIDALGHTTTLDYTGNGEGQPTAITDANSHKWQFGYIGGDIASISDPLSHSTNFFTDSVGRVQSVTDPLGRMTQITYDNMDRPVQSVDAQGGVTKLGYDYVGTLTSAEDARQVAAGTSGKSHGYTPDSRNRMHVYTDPLGNTATYNYDGMNNLTSILDRNGQTTSMLYDGLNRPTQVTYNDGSTIKITWNDSADQVVMVDSVNGTVTITYDDLFRIKQEVSPQGTVAYLYDNANRRTQMTVTGAGQSTSTIVTYGYYDNNWLKTVTQGTNVTTLAYYNNGQRKTVTLPNGIVGTYTYNNDNTLQNIAYTNGATSVLAMGYTYDAADELVSATNGTLPTGVVAVSSATYDAANRLTVWGSNSLTYDNNGNLLTGFGNAYGWNARNQLTSNAGNAVTYDARGRQVSRKASATAHTSLYDGGNPVLLDGSNFMEAGLGLDDNFARINGATVTSMLSDNLGSTRMMTNASGASTVTYSYDPYGNTSVASGTDSTPFEYTGRENQGTGGLYYYRNRYYMPQVGRFISQDPMGLDAGMNVYAYANGNPLGFVDSTGLCADTNRNQRCEKLRNTIKNLVQNLERRRVDLKRDKKQLDWDHPDDDAKPGLSIRGHTDYLIPMDKFFLANALALYQYFCTDGNGPPPVPYPGPHYNQQTANDAAGAFGLGLGATSLLLLAL